MRYLLKLSYLTMVLLFSINVVAFAQVSTVKGGELSVCVTDYNIPFTYKDKISNDIIGFDVDLIKGFAAYLNLKPVFITVEWQNIFDFINQSRCDVSSSSITITTERREKVNFSDPYYAGGLTLLVNNSKRGMINTFKDINSPGIRVGTGAGVSAETILRSFFKKPTIVTYPKIEDAVIAVANGQVDVMVYDNIYINKTHDDSNVRSKTYIIDSKFTYEPYGVAIHKGNPALLAAFNTYFATIKQNGTYEQLIQKWFGKVVSD